MSKEDIEEQILELTTRLERSPGDEQLLLERGNLYWKMQDWNLALRDYDAAIEINRESAAVELRKMAQQIIGFYHKDRYNP